MQIYRKPDNILTGKKEKRRRMEIMTGLLARKWALSQMKGYNTADRFTHNEKQTDFGM